MKKYKELFVQAIHFFCISGIGWLIDMIIYTLLTSLFNLDTVFSNICSSLCAVTYVYLVSTHKTFKNESKNINLKTKYFLYVLYQIIIITISSLIIGKLSVMLLKSDILFIINYNKTIAKILFTPITMITNFIFMKWLIEKL